MTKKTTKTGNKVNKELDAVKKQAEEYYNDLKRVQAEFDNFMKRTEKEKQMLLKFAAKDLILKLIEVNDDFDRALGAIRKGENKEEMLTGIEMIAKEFKKILESEGVKPIEAIGEKFDPHLHEVLKQVDSDKEPNTIVEEIQKGYQFHDFVLRPSRVIVSKEE